MLIGLYLTTPITKPFLNTASDKEVGIALTVLFILSSLIPLLELYGVEMANFLSTTPYIFIYMLGYYLQWRVDYKKSRRNISLSIILIIISLVSIITRGNYGINTNCYADPASISIAASLFILMNQLDAKSTIAEKLSPYCFCVYLIHTVFINLSYKILDITPLNTFGSIPLAVAIPIFFTVFTILSFAGAFILTRIPLLKKHVL